MRNIHDVFSEIGNEKAINKKVEILQKNETDGIKAVLRGTYDLRLQWLVPDTKPPFEENEEKKDMFYQEQTRERKRDAGAVADRLRKKLDAKKVEEEKQKIVEVTDKSEAEDNTNEASTNEEKIPTESKSKHNLSNNLDNLANQPISEPEKQVQFNVADSNSKEVSFDEAEASLQAEDPWMQRKREEVTAVATDAAAAAASSSTPTNEEQENVVVV